jgi:ParB/RepB/Spo0J family partition protein
MRKTATDLANEAQLKTIAIEAIDPHPKNPRLAMREDVIEGIRAQLNGQMTPEHALRVRPKADRFELISGHQRIEAARRAGLKQVPCWVRDMDDDEAYMSLLTDNAQGELSPLEIGVHAFRIGKGNKWGGPKGKEYAEQIGRTPDFISKVKSAAEVALSIKLPCGNLTERHRHLAAIHALPKSAWDSFVATLVGRDWSLKDTEAAVGRTRSYLDAPAVADMPDYLPVEPCAIAVGTGAKLPTDFKRLAGLAEKVRAELAEASNDLAAEWLAWLAERSGGDSWDVATVQAKRIELEDRAAALSNAKKRAKVEPPGLVLADPPWRYDFAETDRRQVENQYPTATTEEIVAMAPQTADDCVILLWATAPKLEDALAVMTGWGFAYKTHAVWDKEKIGMGYWFRGQHELLLVGTKGDAAPPPEAERTGSVFRESRAKHSTKPESVYAWIERAFPGLVKLEMFARKPRDGWQLMGNEA